MDHAPSSVARKFCAGPLDPLISGWRQPTPASGSRRIERVIESTQRGSRTLGATECTSFIRAGNVDAASGLRAPRDAGLDVICHAGEASLKSQMKRADASGAEFAVIIGETELASDSAAVKNLRAPLSGTESEQRIVPLQILGDTLVIALSAAEQDH